MDISSIDLFDIGRFVLCEVKLYVSYISTKYGMTGNNEISMSERFQY